MQVCRNRLFTCAIAAAITAAYLSGCGGEKRRNPLAVTTDRPEKTDKAVSRSEADERIRATLDRGDAKSAEKLARAHISTHPADGEAYRLLARSLSEQSKPQNEIKAALEKAEALQPGNSEVRLELAKILDKQAQDAIASDDTGAAIALWKRCLALNYKPREIEKHLAEAYRRHGERLYAAGKLDEAEKSFREAVTLLPDNPVPRLNLANLLMNEDRLLEAQRELKELTKTHPSFGKALIAYAKLLRRMGDIKGATQAVERVLEYEPGNREAAAFKRELENIASAAVKSSSETSSGTPADKELLKELAYLESIGDSASQLNLLERWLIEHPEASWARLRLAALYERLGKPEAALKLLESYLADSPQDVRANLLKARCLITIGHAAEALSALQAIEASNADNLYVKDELGIAYAKLGKFDEARACWQKVVAENPTFAPSLFNLGQLAMEEGKSDEARSWFEKAISQDPANVKYRYFAGLNLKQAGFLRETADTWQSAKVYLTPSDPYAERIEAALDETQNELVQAKTVASAAATTLSGILQAPPAIFAPTSISLPMPQSSGDLKGGTTDPRYLAALEDARAGRYTEAIATLQQILQTSPNDFNARMNLGNLFMVTHKPAEAAAQYLHALRLERGNQNALKALASAYDELGLRGYAAGAIARSMGKSAIGEDNTGKSNPRAFEPLVKALLANNLPEEALAIITAGVNENPDYIDLIILQGDVLAALEQSAQAEAAYRRALAVDNQNPLAMIRLGDLYFTRGQNDMAIEQYRMALKSPLITPDDMFAVVDRFGALGLRNEALEVLNRLKGMNLSDSQLAKLRERTGSNRSKN